VPALTVPDNLKAGVQHACFYEPELNPTYQDYAILDRLVHQAHRLILNGTSMRRQERTNIKTH
jgi:hypothetical protein